MYLPLPNHTVTGSLYEKKGGKDMNILFILKSFEIGGLEVVSAVLADKFVEERHNVSVLAFGTAKHSIEERLDKRVHTYTLSKLECSAENVYAMRAVMLDEKIQVVINQWGLPFVPIKVARKAAKGLGIKIISVYHNNPSFNGRIQSTQIEIGNAKSSWKKCLLRLKKMMFKEITSYGMRYNYNHSDLYIVLSVSFIDVFKKFAKVKNPKHLVVQTNPVTIDTKGFVYSEKEKNKEIVYVGRLDNVQKCVFRVIETWLLLEKNNPNWRLTIVGGGPERENLESLVKDKGLKRVSFEGFCNPLEYYKRASILVLTSDFEGFPLVLAECMSFGVVPVVYDSYPAVRDIIKDGVNGMIVEPVNGKFVTADMAVAIKRVMSDDTQRFNMAKEAIKTSEGYSVDNIYKKWMKVFKVLVNGENSD